MKTIKEKKLLYHLTSIKNLDSIFEHGLLSRKAARSLNFEDVANEDIIVKRGFQQLDDYVPFHFHPSSAFDNEIKYTYGAENFVYITIRRNYAKYNKFKIIPSHPLNPDCKIYNYDEGFEKIEWEIMETKKEEFPDEESREYGKQVKMAECIGKSPIYADCFFKIYCCKNSLEDLKIKYRNYPDLFEEGFWFD